MATVWACGQCRSINQPRDRRCYACRTPRAVGEVDPLKLSATDRAPVVKGPIGTYHSTTGLALLATVLIGGAVAVNLVLNVIVIGIIDAERATGVAAPASGDAIGTSVIIVVATALLALLAWAAWLSRAVANLPALGLGFGRTSPSFVFVESLIPGYNIWKVHRIVMDILRRIHPSPRDEMAVVIAWLPLVLSVVITYVMGRVMQIARRLPGDPEVPVLILGQELVVGLQLVAGLFLIALIWRVEGRLRRQRREIGA